MNDIDSEFKVLLKEVHGIKRELKALLKEAKELTFNEHCKTCFQDRRFCDGCRLDGNTAEPEMYLSARDMLLQCELDSRND